jgi:hypothetical protein
MAVNLDHSDLHDQLRNTAQAMRDQADDLLLQAVGRYAHPWDGADVTREELYSTVEQLRQLVERLDCLAVLAWYEGRHVRE